MDKIELWARFINAESKEELEKIAAKDPYIARAYEQLKIISQDKEKRLQYEAREKVIREYNQSMKEAQEAGKEEREKIGE